MRVEDQFLYPLFFAFSPYTIWNNFACLVYSDGIIGYGSGNFIVSFSYGSPNTKYGNSAIDVGINGGVGNSYYAVVDDSYGNSPDNDWIARDDYVLYVDLDGSLGDVYDVERSYGYKLDSISGHKLERLFL